MGINYKEIESVSVGYKEDYNMYSMDFEEFLWARGFSNEQIDDLYKKMINLEPLSDLEFNTYLDVFHEYMVIGGMPKVVDTFVTNNNFQHTLKLQRQIILDYEEDITKYAGGLDKAKILNVYRKIPLFLGQDNKKFQISKVAHGARNREYIGVVDWLVNAGFINQCFCLENPELPLKGNYNPENYKLYFMDTGLLVASLDDEAADNLMESKNYGTYKGAIYENVVNDMLVKSGYPLFFYRNEKSTIEMDFFVRDHRHLIPVEVKAKDGATISLNKMINDEKFKDIKYGIKFCKKTLALTGNFIHFHIFWCSY